MSKFTDLLVDYKGDPNALDITIRNLGGAMAVLVGAPNYVKVKDYYVLRVFGDPGFVKFACEHQGYCKIIGETDALKEPRE